MEINTFTIYIVGQLGSIKALFLLISIACLVAFSLMLGAYINDWIDNVEKSIKYMKYLLSIAITLSILTVLIPSKETIAAMYVIPKLINNEKIVNIGDNTLTILQGLTDKWIRELNEEKK